MRGQNDGVSVEIERLKKLFPNTDENKLKALDSLIEQAAYERIFLRRLNSEALKSGLVKTHPKNKTLQKKLPVSGEIVKHAAALTNITDKLVKHLGAPAETDDLELEDYE